MNTSLKLLLGVGVLFVAGCLQDPTGWYENFESFDRACLTPSTGYLLTSLQHFGESTDSEYIQEFQDSLTAIFSAPDIRFVPSDERYPDSVTLQDTTNPDNTLFLRRHGWKYCVEGPLSTALFLPLRKVSY